VGNRSVAEERTVEGAGHGGQGNGGGGGGGGGEADVKNSGRPAPGRLVSSSDSGDMVCAPVKPTIMARKMMRASPGADQRRTAELRRAAGRRAREVTTQTR
jgi:hypothetical protein